MSNSRNHGGVREGSGRKATGYELSSDRVDFEAQRARHEKLKADEREFRLAIARGEHLPRVAVSQAQATALAMLAQSLRTIPDAIERKYSLPPEIVEAIASDIDHALTGLANGFKSIAGE